MQFDGRRTGRQRHLGRLYVFIGPVHAEIGLGIAHGGVFLLYGEFERFRDFR